ncbi:MAG: hypothetical protein RLZZ608_1471 [Actinomycetota bacterium]
MTAPDARPSHVVVRGRAGRWMHGLVIAAAVVVSGSWGLLSDVVGSGIPTIVVSLIVLAAFGVLALCVATVTTRWRTSLRFDGVALVVRDPLGARVVPLRGGLALGRWLDSRQRPVNWILDGGRPLASLSPDLDPVRLEAFAHSVGLPVADLDGAPGSTGSLGRDTPD